MVLTSRRSLFLPGLPRNYPRCRLLIVTSPLRRLSAKFDLDQTPTKDFDAICGGLE